MCLTHPCRYALAHTLLESQAEGAIAAITALVSQLLGRDSTLFSNSIAIEANEMADAQVVDVGIVIRTLTGEILAEVKAVGTYGFGQLLQREVVLQVELRGDAVLCQLSFDLGEVDIDGSCRCLLCLSGGDCPKTLI